MNMEEYIVYERTGYSGWGTYSNHRGVIEFTVARRCDHDGSTVPKSQVLATFPVGMHSEARQRARATMLANAMNVQAAAMPPLKLEIA